MVDLDDPHPIIFHHDPVAVRGVTGLSCAAAMEDMLMTAPRSAAQAGPANLVHQ